MLDALLWGAISGSAVLIGAIVGVYIKIKKRLIGFIMSFGTGVLIGAACFELLRDSVKDGGLFPTAIGFLLGALLFTIVDLVISKKGGKDRKRSRKNPENHTGLAIFFGSIFDTIPESIVIGVSLLDQSSVSYLLVIAIFISNFPEGLSSSVGLKKDGYSNKKILFLWVMVLALSSLSSFSGYALLHHASDMIVGGIGAFAAGAVVSMVSSTMMPEAFEEGGPTVGFVTALGLLFSLILSNLQ